MREVQRVQEVQRVREVQHVQEVQRVREVQRGQEVQRVLLQRVEQVQRVLLQRVQEAQRVLLLQRVCCSVLDKPPKVRSGLNPANRAVSFIEVTNFQHLTKADTSQQ